MPPLFFGDSKSPLFGFHHPPAGDERRTGVVVCAPFGQEALRAHRPLRELASRLAEAGFHTLRFDYHGTGDAAGEAEQASIEGWIDDVGTAADEIREAADLSAVAFVGLRLGGTLAVEAARRRTDVAALGLWDPVLDGSAYVAELSRQHAAWFRDHAPRARLLAGEVLGFPFPPGLAAGAAGLQVEAAALPARAWLGTSAGRPVPVLGGRSYREFGAVPVWLHAEGMERALVPGDLVADLVSWLAAECR